MFAPEKWTINDNVAFIQNKPAELFIDTLEDSEIEIINSNFFDTTESCSVEFYKTEFYRLLKRTSVLQERVIMLMSTSALTRYQHFINTYPQLLQRIPQKMIASYLGITPEALSKIRSNWTKKQ